MKTRANTITRRSFVQYAGTLAGFASSSRIRRATADVFRGYDPFPFSVASGEPTASGVVLWTKLARSAADLTPVSDAAIEVEWVVARDEQLRDIVRRGVAVAEPQWGHSIHAIVEGLDPARWYWYGFRAGGKASPVGRTRTLPAQATSLRFAVASCQHWEEGYFTAYDGMIDDDTSFVVHLGDYIYDVPRSGPRRHDTAKSPDTLDAFRRRYALYRTDPSLRRAHECLPFFLVPDNHDALEDNSDDDALLRKRAAAYQARYEFLPLRHRPDLGSASTILFRGVDIGDLVRINLLDTRQFKDRQDVCKDGADATYAFGIYQPPCAALDEARRSMLGRAQATWLQQRVRSSPAAWNVIGSTVPMTPFDLDRDGALYRYVASWDGYPAERRRLLEQLAAFKTANPVVLSGDIHSSLVSRVAAGADRDPATAIATEFVGTSISSGWPAPLARPMQDNVGRNPQIGYYDSQKRGYLRCTVTRASWTTDLRTVSFVDRPGGAVTTDRAFVVETGSVGALPA
jgi:alkaline phosphatase D